MLVVAVIALLAAGCGGSSDSSSDASPTTEWADGLCSAISSWTDSIKSIGDTLTAGNVSQDALSSAVDDAKSATETFTSDLDSLGKPDTEAGEQAKEMVDKLSSDLKDGIAKIEDAVSSASGVSGVLSALSVATSTLVTMGNQVASTVSGFEQLDVKGELEDAFKQASSCQQLTGS